MNPHKIGIYKRPEHNASASWSTNRWMSPWTTQQMRNRVVRIYMPQRKHVHCHPQNKSIGKYWVIEFDNWGSYKSPLMGWTNGTHDAFNNHQMKFPRLKDAITFAQASGWGYDVSYPTNWRWHTKKNYADNFAWKGQAKPEEAYD